MGSNARAGSIPAPGTHKKGSFCEKAAFSYCIPKSKNNIPYFISWNCLLDNSRIDANDVMNIEEFRTYCLEKTAVEESFPFDENILVFKVMGKMFAATNVNAEEYSINLKCDPERAIELRESHSCIRPGYHMNKKHWNSIYIAEGIARPLLLELINHSYDLVVSKLKKSDQKILNDMQNES